MSKNRKKNYKDIWLDEPLKHDFPAALDYLELLMNRPFAESLIEQLEDTDTVLKKAKDILRASGLPLLSKTNVHVKENLKKVKSGKKLSPILLLRYGKKLIIADGYHRLCSIYYLSEDLTIPCRLV